MRAIQVTQSTQYTNTRQQHFDVIRAILEKRKQLSSTICYVHVRGHQDSKKKFEELTRLEQLNVMCDKYAKEANSYIQPIQSVHLRDEGLSLWHQDQKIYSSFRQNIKQLYWNEKAQAILCTKYGWEPATFRSICWDALDRAMHMLSSPIRIRIAKFVTHTLPVGRVMERRGGWQQSFCPRCGKDDETPHHVVKCDNDEARITLKKALLDLESKLILLDTEPRLLSELITSISTWLTVGKVRKSKSTCRPIECQNQLGWHHFIEGRLHKSFQDYMDQYYTNIGSNKNGELWATIMIQTMWTKIFEPMWKSRNAAAHCRTTKDKKSREVLNLNYIVRQLYERATSTTLLHQDRYLLDDPISSVLRSPTGTKRGWILSMKHALLESEKAIITENMSMRNSMQRFRETGSCTQCLQCDTTPDHQETPEFTTPSRKKKFKRHPARKRLRPLLSYSTRSGDYAISKKKRKLNGVPRKKKKSRCSRSRTLPTILEDWEFESEVRKKK